LTEIIINGKIQELMMNKELFEGPVGDYCIARNTIKFLFSLNHLVTHCYLDVTPVVTPVCRVCPRCWRPWGRSWERRWSLRSVSCRSSLSEMTTTSTSDSWTPTASSGTSNWPSTRSLSSAGEQRVIVWTSVIRSLWLDLCIQSVADLELLKWSDFKINF